MNIAPILASVVAAPSDALSDPNDLLNTILPILAVVVPGLVVLAIMVFVTLRKNLPR